MLCNRIEKIYKIIHFSFSFRENKVSMCVLEAIDKVVICLRLSVNIKCSEYF